MNAIRDMHILDYHADPAISKTRLDLLHRSPAHYKAEIDNPTPATEAMLWGTMFHAFILQPDVFDCEYFALECNPGKRSKDDKEIWAAAQAEHPGKTIICKDDMDALLAMRDSLMSHSLARVALSGGVPEQSIFWTAHGVQCRCRPDYWRQGVLYDIKTTTDARPEAFSRACWNYRYHVQSAFYLDGYHNVTDEPVGDFVFVAIEKKPPYAVAMYHANEAMVEQGRNEYLRDLEVYRECLAMDVWPGYSEEITSILLPRWAQEDEE